MRLIPIVLVLFLSGCEATSYDQDMALACSSYNDAGETANAFYNVMSESQRQAVDDGINVIGPICKDWTAGRIVSSQQLLRTVNASLAEMLAATQEFE